MGLLSPKLRSQEGGRIAFWCPGCKEMHRVTSAWTFDGNVTAPTFSPSILVTSGHYAPGHTGKCWCDFNREHPGDTSFECSRCHSFVRAGRIQFLTDCTHELAGQTVDIPDWPASAD